ncbi:Tripartite tricarboxylate transporter family receptor [Pigmentiphaga humi]|uniref:Tripartite tricarboxylate transporter family receptor n=1 Tax=Pigmentiphaga humi TaxID=2478468 RepID=A0A3P4B893_9BURK|nr:tripartite tricarboxylate transporter substrate binding protein [Pigmentiphaga humi]VCU71908.1 Tripartite tricarboxylate transporter family receptor [Pigmentiphaga humi]
MLNAIVLIARRIAVCLGLAVASQAAVAADWPAKPVTIVVPYAAGGNTDLMARVTAEALSQFTGKRFVVENRGGAGGTIAAEYVAKLANDGHTLFFGTVGQLSTAPFTNRIKYDPQKDFIPIANVGGNPCVFAASPNAPFKTLQEMVAYGKAHPGKMTIGNAGIGGLTHLSSALFLSQSKIDAVLVPYKGASAALADALAGQIDFYSGSLSEVLPHAKSGSLRMLAVTSPGRDASLPDVPAISEMYPGYSVETWNGLLAPAGLPASGAAYLIEAMRKIHADPAFQKKLLNLGITPIPEFGDDFRKRIVADTEKWGPVIQAAGIVPE